ncbi:MAG: hypothetical protein Q4A69_04615 [Moraxella sp.]|nr:hypothetical protein [Moraxella sp.]
MSMIYEHKYQADGEKQMSDNINQQYKWAIFEREMANNWLNI